MTALFRDYAPSVMYESGKVLFIGGGLDPVTQLPTNLAETIDLNQANPQWQPTSPDALRPAATQRDGPAGRHRPGDGGNSGTAGKREVAGLR